MFAETLNSNIPGNNKNKITVLTMLDHNAQIHPTCLEKNFQIYTRIDENFKIRSGFILMNAILSLLALFPMSPTVNTRVWEKITNKSFIYRIMLFAPILDHSNS